MNIDERDYKENPKSDDEFAPHLTIASLSPQLVSGQRM
jgi:hypothetical protein